MTNRSLTRLICSFSLTVCLLLASASAQAQATPAVTVRVAPAIIEVPLGQIIDVAVEVVAVQDLYGFDIAAKFDPSVVEVVDTDPNEVGIQTALGVLLDSGFVVLNAADNLTGTVRFAMTQLNPSDPKSGTGALIVIRLRGKQVSDGSPLTLTGVQLAKRDGTSLSTNLVSGAINVVSLADSAPVSTPIPTQGAGTPMPTATSLSVSATASPSGMITPPTLTPVTTSPTATPTPRPTDQSVSAVASTPIESATLPSTSSQPTDIKSATATLEVIVAQPSSTATAVANTPVAVAAISEPSITPSTIQSAMQVTEPAPSTVNSSGSVAGLLAVSGILGIAGLITVWFVTRRRPH